MTRGGRRAALWRLWSLAAVLLMTSGGGEAGAQVMTTRDLLALPQPAADHRIAYGSARSQFGELWFPAGTGPHPVVVFVHGGCWLAEYDLRHAASFAAGLKDAGVATWSLEYRRVGEPGGGWPGTFEDVSRGTDVLRDLAGRFPLDLARVAVVGHSAGGHLALWVASRGRVSADSGLRVRDPLAVSGAVGLAAIPDLAAAAREAICGDAVVRLLGGGPDREPARYLAASPAAQLPLGVRQWLVHGARDTIVPVAMAADHQRRAAAAGDRVSLAVVPDAGHFELIAPGSVAWPEVLAAIRAALGENRKGADAAMATTEGRGRRRLPASAGPPPHAGGPPTGSDPARARRSDTRGDR